ncbi:MAG: radical SAM protein [Methanotrichaceae archaeon]|nr:radical SAM protein [Methanotrichaceae archaeon]
MSSESGLLQQPTVREGLLYEKKEDIVVCNLCERRCHIAANRNGFCKTRINYSNKLYTIVYGDISAINSRPIEIKPFFHFYPGSSALTLSTWSCNFPCPWCQNFHLSNRPPAPNFGNFIAPEDIVKRAGSAGDEGICISFNEPTLLFEYCLDLFPLSREHGLCNCFVSNGYMTLEALRMLKDNRLDAIKIDVKENDEVYKNYCSADSEVVWRNIREAKRLGMHVEVVNLIINGLNDTTDCIDEVIQRCREIDPSIPLHFTRYFPAHQFSSPATDVEVLEKACSTAKEGGIKFPYIGNVPGHDFENTYCPSCGEVLIERLNHRIVAFRLKDKRCPTCGESIPIVTKR